MFSISPSAHSSNASRSSCARTLFEKKFSMPLIWFLPFVSCKIGSVAKIHSLNALPYNELKLRNPLIRHKPSGNQNK